MYYSFEEYLTVIQETTESGTVLGSTNPLALSKVFVADKTGC